MVYQFGSHTHAWIIFVYELHIFCSIVCARCNQLPFIEHFPPMRGHKLELPRSVVAVTPVWIEMYLYKLLPDVLN